MSKTITIPSDRGNPVNVTLNGVSYSYPAGSTQTVPDAVAALFAANAGQNVEYGRQAAAPQAAPERKGDKPGVKVLTDDQGYLYADAGDITKAALSAIHVEGHTLVISEE